MITKAKFKLFFWTSRSSLLFHSQIFPLKPCFLKHGRGVLLYTIFVYYKPVFWCCLQVFLHRDYPDPHFIHHLMFRRKSGAFKMTTLSAVSLQKVFPYGRLKAKQKQVILFNANGTSNLNFSLDRTLVSSYCCWTLNRAHACMAHVCVQTYLNDLRVYNHDMNTVSMVTQGVISIHVDTLGLFCIRWFLQFIPLKHC